MVTINKLRLKLRDENEETMCFLEAIELEQRQVREMGCVELELGTQGSGIRAYL